LGGGLAAAITKMVIAAARPPPNTQPKTRSPRFFAFMFFLLSFSGSMPLQRGDGTNFNFLSGKFLERSLSEDSC